MIKIVKKSAYSVEIKNSHYLGEKYRVSAKLGNDIISLYHNSELKKGESLYIDFNKDDILNF